MEDTHKCSFVDESCMDVTTLPTVGDADFIVHDLPSVWSLSTKSDYVKNGSNMLLMQLALGLSAGFSKKAFIMSFGQLLA